MKTDMQLIASPAFITDEMFENLVNEFNHTNMDSQTTQKNVSIKKFTLAPLSSFHFFTSKNSASVSFETWFDERLSVLKKVMKECALLEDLKKLNDEIKKNNYALPATHVLLQSTVLATIGKLEKYEITPQLTESIAVLTQMDGELEMMKNANKNSPNPQNSL